MIYLTTALFLLSFLGVYGYLCRFLPFRQRPYALLFSYPVFFAVQVLVCFLSIYAKVPVVVFLLAACLGNVFHLKAKRFGLLITVGLLSFPLGFFCKAVPIADSDSVGYVLPMADNALVHGTMGVTPTDNTRTLARFWGHTAQVSNLISLNQGNIATTKLVTILGLGFCAITIFYFGRKIGRKFNKWCWLILLAPPVLCSVGTAKDDWVFAGFALLGVLLAMRRWKGVPTWSTLLLFGCTIVSKQFFPIPFLLILVLVPGWATRVRLAGWMVLAWLLVVAAHTPRIIHQVEVFGPSARTFVAATCGASPHEFGVPYADEGQAIQLQADHQAGKKPTHLPRILESLRSLEGIQWSMVGQHNFGWLWMYNYSVYGLFWIGIAAGVLCLLRKNRRLAVSIAIGTVFFFAIMPDASAANLRYIGFLFIVAWIGLVAYFPWRRCLIGFCSVLLLYPAAMATSTALRTSLETCWRANAVLYPLDTIPFNPTLLSWDRTALKLQLDQCPRPIAFSGIRPGFDARFLFGDRSTIPTMIDVPISILSQLPCTIVVAGNWNLFEDNRNLRLIQDGLPQYILIGSSPNDSILIFAPQTMPKK